MGRLLPLVQADQIEENEKSSSILSSNLQKRDMVGSMTLLLRLKRSLKSISHSVTNVQIRIHLYTLHYTRFYVSKVNLQQVI